MQVTVSPARIKGHLIAPASKSVAQRAIAIASLARGESEIHYVGDCDDVLAAIEVCRKLGAGISGDKNLLKVSGGIRVPQEPLICGEAGLGIRMFSAIASTLPERVVLTGEGSLLKRPMDMIEQSLRAIGVECFTQNGFAPVTVKGPIPGGTAYVDGSVSSQVLTGLLIAAPLALKPLKILVSNLKSRPYIDITIETMKAFGTVVVNKDYQEFTIPAPQQYKPGKYTVEGDWSGASFPLVAGAIAGEIRVSNLKMDSTQADRAILDTLEKCGAFLEFKADSVVVAKKELNAFDFDATHCPDLFPPLVALAASCKGKTSIKGVSRLAVKESDRAAALKQEFGKLGISISIDNDIMHITGSSVKAAAVHSHHDHRIAMACALAALVADAPVLIEGAESVAKSYPGFFDDLKAVSLHND